MEDGLGLLLARADDHRPALAPRLPAPAPAQVERRATTSRLRDDGADPNDLRAQRWGVLAPLGEAGDRMLAAIRPLIELRSAQQGAEAPIYRAPFIAAADVALRWKKKLFETGADLSLEVPRYLLILGELDQISLVQQQVQAIDGFVGRLAFAREADFAAYAGKVVAAERRVHGPPRALLMTARDGSEATERGRQALILPSLEIVRKRLAAGQFPACEPESLDGEHPDPDALLARAAAPTPTVLLSLSHGEGPPAAGWSSAALQRERQGAMCFGAAGTIAAGDVAARPFLPDGAWFMFACNSAGTPTGSAFRPWLEVLGRHNRELAGVLATLPGPGDRPFTAALPRAALANPRGPLVFFGHIDLAWTYSFRECDRGVFDRPARFTAILRALLRGDRAGVALRELLRFLDQANTELLSLYDGAAQARSLGLAARSDDARLGYLWMLRQDLAGYVVLGDPAARLAIGAASVASASAPVATPNREPAAPSDPLERVERAIARALLGETDLAALAAAAGVSRASFERDLADYRAAGRRALLGRRGP